MRSKDVLKSALAQFDGTLIIVSHDRYFLNELTERTLEFKNQEIREHLGDIQAFLRRKQIDNLREIERKEAEKKNTSKENKNTESKLNYKERKEFNKKTKRLERQIVTSEENINKLETLIEECETKLAKGENLDTEFYSNYEKYKLDLDQEMENWEKASDKLEKV